MATQKTKKSKLLMTADWKSIFGLVKAIINLVVEIMKRL